MSNLVLFDKRGSNYNHLGVKDKKILKFSFKYSITNYRFKINVFKILSKKFDNNPDIIWIKKSEISKIPIPTLFKKILN